MQINITYDASVSNAPAGFTTAVNAAVAYYENNYDAPGTVNITIGWGSAAGETIPSGALGATWPDGFDFNYQEVRNALWADATTPQALTAAINLPAADPTNGGVFFMTSAEAKALGLVPSDDSSTDGTIVIDPTTSYTFDPNNRAVAGKVDLIGVLEHEIGHVLGRVSGLGMPIPGGGALYGALDLFRYSAPGVLAPTATAASFSIDSQNLLLPFNDPSNGGDADDWSVNLTGDAFDAFGDIGVQEQMSSTDQTMLDIFGFHPHQAQPSSPGPDSGSIQLTDANSGAITISKGTFFIGLDAVHGYQLANGLGPLTNTGTLSSIATSDDSVAIYTTNGPNSGFNNTTTGIISAEADADGAISYAFYYGAVGPQITNAGLIQSVSQGTAYGLFDYAGHLFTNAAGGTMRVWGKDGAVGIYEFNGGYLDNAGLIEVAGGQYAIGVAGEYEFNNSGTIKVTSLGAGGHSIGVDIYGPGAPLAGHFTNSGIIIADDAIYVDQSSTSPPFEPNVNFVNSGTVIGDIVLANGINQIHNTGVIAGNIYFGDSAATYDGAGGHLYGDIFLGFGHNTVTLGNDGDTVYGGNGADTITGGAGDDTFMIARGYNAIDGGGGFNTLSLQSAAMGYTVDLGAGTAAGPLTSTIAHIQRVIGSTFADILIAGNTAATLVGGGGADTLRGGAGADTLVAGPGGDTLTGGGGNDTFIYIAGDGQMVITDFRANGDQDILDIYGYASAQSTVQQGSDTLITLSGGDSILLKNISPAALSGGAPVYNAAAYAPPLTSVPLPVFGTTPITLEYALSLYTGERIAMDFGTSSGTHAGITVAGLIPGDSPAAPNTPIVFSNFATASFTANGGTVYGVQGQTMVANSFFQNGYGANFSVINHNGDAAGIHGSFPAFVNAGTFTVAASGAPHEVDGIYTDGFQEVFTNATGAVLSVHSDSSGAAGLSVHNGGGIRNYGLIDVSGTGTVYGVFEDGFSDVWTDFTNANSGTIRATSTSGTAIGVAIGGDDAPTRGPTALVNNGLISAQIAIKNLDLGYSDNSSPSIALSNSGTIDGDIDLSGFSSSITNNIGGVINGNIFLRDDWNLPSLRAVLGRTGGDTVDLRNGSFSGTIAISPGAAGNVNDHYTIYTGTLTTTVKFIAGQSQMTATITADSAGQTSVQYDIASTAASWSKNSDGSWTVSAGTDGAETLFNVTDLRFTDRTVTLNHHPVVTTANLSARTGQTLALSSMFSVSDPDGDTITRYELKDSGPNPFNGYFAVAGVAQPANTVIDITAAQLSQTSYILGTSGDSLQIRAFDGQAWSAADNANWSPFTVTPLADHPPVVTTNNLSSRASRTLALSSLFSVSDVDGDAITQYQLYDNTSDPNSGHFVINGQAQPAQLVLNLTASQLTQASFVTGTVSDTLQIRASDGTLWSAADNANWAPFTVTVLANHPPVVATANVTLPHFQTYALSSLVSVSDADGDMITRYQLYDGTSDPNSGHFMLNGQALTARQVIDLTAAQFTQASFVTGSVSDDLQVRAFDGLTWSAADSANWAPFTVSVPSNRPPQVATTSQRVAANQTLALSSLISISDADGDAMSLYQLYDGISDPNSGHFMLNGQALPARQVIQLTAAQFAQTSFVTGTVNDDLQARAFDGIAWSAADSANWSPFTIGPGFDHAPVVTTADKRQTAGQTTALSSLISVSDADGDTMTRYQLYDGGSDPNSGHFAVNGQVQSSHIVIDLTAAQAAQTSFVTGTVNDNLQIRVFDGFAWSAADSANWAPFTIGPTVNHAPVLTTSDTRLMAGQSISLASLLSISDADGDAMTRYQLYDGSSDPASGHFVVNGQVQSARIVIDLTAAQAAQTSFTAGSVNDNLQVRVFDGQDWSADYNASWSPFTVGPSVNHAPSVNTSDLLLAHSQTFGASSLFNVSDADGDAMTRYQLWDDTTDPNSGHFAVNGVTQAAHTVIDITAGQLGQTSFVTGTAGDALQIRAFDGQAWSAPDSGLWAPFQVNVS